MPDLFTDLSGPGPFTDVPVSEAPVTNAQAQFRRAQVAAAANIDLDQDQSTLLDQFGALQQQYLDNIAQYGEGQAEADAARRQIIQRTEGLVNLARDIRPSDDSIGLGAAINEATTAQMNADIQREAEAALERAAVDKITDLAASGDRVTAEAYLNLMESGSVFDQQREFMTKAMVLQREIDRYRGAHAEDPWWTHVVNFGVSLIPFQNSLSQTGIVDIPDSEKGLLDWMFAGDRRRTEAASLWNLPAEEFARVVRDRVIPQIDQKSSFFLDQYQSNSEAMELLEGLVHTPRPLYNNLGNALDNLGWIGVAEVVGATKIASSIPRMMTAAGARRQVAAMTANALRNGSLEGMDDAIKAAGFVDNAEVIDNLSPAAIKPQSFGTNGQSLANEMLEKGRSISERLNAIMQTGRFADDAERQAAITNFIEKETESFGQSRVIDVDRTSEVRLTDNSRVHSMEFTLGRNNTDGFVKEQHARRYADNLGFEDARVEQIEGGTWVVKVNRVMPETGSYTNPLRVKTSNVLSRFLLGARQRSDEYLFNRAQISEGSRNAFITSAREDLWKDVKVGGAEKERVAQLWAYGDNKAMWFEDRGQANIFFQRNFGRDIGDREWTAYNRMRDINDLEYAVRNDGRWKEMALRGLETVRADIGIGQIDGSAAFVDEGMTRAIRGRAYNMADNSFTNKLTPEEIENLKDRGFILVHLDEAKKLDGDLGDITAVIAKRSDIRRSTLDPVQLPYRPGGHRIYSERFFAKQAFKDGENWKNPHTYVVGTKAEVTEWSNTMEQARLAYLNDPTDLSAIDDIFAGRPGYPTAEKFVAGIDSGLYSKDYSFGAYFDRDMPKEYDNAVRDFMPEEPEDGLTSYLRTSGRLYYGQKADEALVDWRGEQAPTLDAFESIDRAFTNIANLSTFSDYKITAVNRWVNTFGKWIDSNSVPSDATAMQKFLDGKPIRGARYRDGVLQAMEDQRQIILRNLGWKTEFDMGVEQMGRNFADFVMGNDPTSVRHGIGRKTVNWMSEQNPLAFMRGLAFDLKLGMFNPVQLFLQTGTYLAINAIDPSIGLKSIGSNPLLRAYMIKDDVLGHMVRSGSWKVAGFETVEEFEAFMRLSKASGFLTINESHSLINAMGPGTVSNLTGNKIHDVRQMGRFFFNEGELINRMTAMRSAWDWAKKQKGPDLNSVNSDDFINAWRGRAEDLSFNMSRTSQAWWQQGLTSIPTQFFSYQARMMEAMFGGVLSRPERIRLVLSQAILYGAAGVPLAPVLMDMYKNKKGEAPELMSPGGFLDRGALDIMINATTGIDVQASDRLGTGSWFGDTVGELMGFSQYGEQSTLDILGGAGFSVTSDLFKDLKPWLAYMAGESGGDLGRLPPERAFRNLAMNMSSYSAAMKFMMIKNHGMYIDNNGNYRVSGIPSQAAWATLLLGAQPGETNDMGAHLNYLKKRGEVVDEAAKVVEQYRREMLSNPDNYEELVEEVNIFVSHLDPDIRKSVLAQAHRQTAPDIASNVEERYQRLRAQEEITKQLEQEAQ